MKTQNNNFKTQAHKNTVNLAIWTLAWVLSMALATFGPRFIWEDNKALTIAAIGFNVIMGVMMILANMRNLNSMDELQRKIQLDAMAISLGVGIVGGLAYSVMDQTDIIPWDAEISFLVILISLTYMVSLFINQKRYL